MIVAPVAAGLILCREEALGVELETNEAAGALEAEGPSLVGGGDALTGRDIVPAHDARPGRLVVGLEHDQPWLDSHHDASTMFRPRSMPIGHVNACSPGSPGMNSIGTTVPVGKRRRLAVVRQDHAEDSLIESCSGAWFGSLSAR